MYDFTGHTYSITYLTLKSTTKRATAFICMCHLDLPSRRVWPGISHSCCRAPRDPSSPRTARRCAPKVSRRLVLQTCAFAALSRCGSHWWATSLARWSSGGGWKAITVLTTNCETERQNQWRADVQINSYLLVSVNHTWPSLTAEPHYPCAD